MARVARRDAKVELIRSAPLFANCSSAQLKAIAQSADVIEVPAGMALVTEGSHTNEFVVIMEGAAKVTKGRRTLSTLGAGDFFGEIALLTGGPRTATVTAIAPSSLLVLTDRAFRRLAKELPTLQANVLKTLAERLHADTV